MIQREDLVRRLTANEGKADLQRQLYDYENKFVLFGQEIGKTQHRTQRLHQQTGGIKPCQGENWKEQSKETNMNANRTKVNWKSKDSELKQLRDAIAQYEV